MDGEIGVEGGVNGNARRRTIRKSLASDLEKKVVASPKGETRIVKWK